MKTFFWLCFCVCLFALFLPGHAFSYQSPPTPKVVVEKKPETVESHVNRIFGKDAKVALAVLKHESGLKLDAINWNCYYYGKSKPCRKEDRHLAWSVDCGIGQTNVRAKACPSELLTLEGNMKKVEKIYKSQGLNAWVSYTSGAYKKFL